MPKLKCDVGMCMYNTNHACKRGTIDVEGPMARSKKDTACLSFMSRSTKNVNYEIGIIDEPSANTYVYCDATNCVFEHDSRCKADKIEIKNVEPCDKKYCDFESKYHDGHWKNSTTMCKTFESRE